jgi:glycosyltransferase involved in cell wall biosynthesis
MNLPTTMRDSAVQLRVLLLAHRFPPMGGAGVQRILQLARHLDEVACDPAVITAPGPVDDRWTPEDAALEDARLRRKVVRIAGPELSPRKRDWMFERWLGKPSGWAAWWKTSVLEATQQAGDVDLVHASVAPYATIDAALAVAERFAVPLVLDFEDPWALDEMIVYPTRIHRRLAVRRMGKALRAADAVVMNTPEARKRVLEHFPELDDSRVFAVANAFDPLDFEGPRPRRTDDEFRIVHAGSLHTDFGLFQRSRRWQQRLLGGGVEGVDYLTRSHVYLLKAIENLLQQRPELREMVRVHLAGVFTDEDRAVSDEYAFVRLHEFLPHAETISMLRSADLLFLPMHDLPPGQRAGIVPHKTYEYLASRTPILAAVPEGDARDLLGGARNAHVCGPRDVDAMTAAVLANLDRKRAGVGSPEPGPELLERCSSARLVRELRVVYDAALAGQSVGS